MVRLEYPLWCVCKIPYEFFHHLFYIADFSFYALHFLPNLLKKEENINSQKLRWRMCLLFTSVLYSVIKLRMFLVEISCGSPCLTTSWTSGKSWNENFIHFYLAPNATLCPICCIPSICSDVFLRNLPHLPLCLLIWATAGVGEIEGMARVCGRQERGELTRLLDSRGERPSTDSSSIGVLTLDLNLLTTFFRSITWLGVRGFSKWLTCS